MAITNPRLQHHSLLQGMYDDDYFPDFLVDMGKEILIRLCEQMEKQRPSDADGVLKLTQAATQEFNKLEDEFEKNGSEIETGAREHIARDFEFIVKAYGFDLHIEDVIATRTW